MRVKKQTKKENKTPKYHLFAKLLLCWQLSFVIYQALCITKTYNNINFLKANLFTFELKKIVHVKSQRT